MLPSLRGARYLPVLAAVLAAGFWAVAAIVGHGPVAAGGDGAIQHPSLWMDAVAARWGALPAALVWALVSTYAIHYARLHATLRAARIGFMVFSVLAPAAVLVATERVTEPLFVATYALASYFLLEFYRREYSFYLFMFAFVLGTGFYIRAELLLMVPVVVVTLPLVIPERRLAVTFLFVSLFPLLFFATVWYALFAGEAAIGDVFRTLLAGRRDQWNLIALLPFVPSVALSSIVIARIGTYREFYASPIFLVFVAPFGLVAAAWIVGAPISTLTLASLPMFSFLVLHPYVSILTGRTRLAWPVFGSMATTVAAAIGVILTG